jgi:hypothetical protein
MQKKKKKKKKKKKNACWVFEAVQIILIIIRVTEKANDSSQYNPITII